MPKNSSMHERLSLQLSLPQADKLRQRLNLILELSDIPMTEAEPDSERLLSSLTTIQAAATECAEILGS